MCLFEGLAAIARLRGSDSQAPRGVHFSEFPNVEQVEPPHPFSLAQQDLLAETISLLREQLRTESSQGMADLEKKMTRKLIRAIARLKRKQR